MTYQKLQNHKKVILK